MDRPREISAKTTVNRASGYVPLITTLPLNHYRVPKRNNEFETIFIDPAAHLCPDVRLVD